MMRFQISSVCVAVFLAMGTNAFAGPSKSSKQGSKVNAPHASVVAIMKDSGQALLWNGDRDEYVVVRRGDRFQDCSVTAIEDEQVVLTRDRTNEHFILPRTSDTSNIARKGTARRSTDSEDKTDRHRNHWDPSDELQDPYPQPVDSPVASNSVDGVLDPYGASGPIPMVSAPKKSTAKGTTMPLDPYRSSAKKPLTVTVTPATTAPLDPYAATAKPTKTSTLLGSPSPRPSSKSAPLDPYANTSGSPLNPYAAVQPSISKPINPYASPRSSKRDKPKGKRLKENHTISRREFDAAVTDFHSISKEVQFTMISEGVRVNGIGRGSRFHRWGFRDNDTILDVDGKRIRGVDDAAAVYAHLMDAKRFKVRITRGVDTIVMHYRFKK